MLRDFEKPRELMLPPALHAMKPGECKQNLSRGTDSDWGFIEPSALGQVNSTEIGRIWSRRAGNGQVCTEQGVRWHASLSAGGARWLNSRRTPDSGLKERDKG